MPAMSAPGEDCAHWPRPTCRPPAGSWRPAQAPPRRPPRSALPSTAGCACVPTAVPRSGRQVQPVQANGMDLGIEARSRQANAAPGPGRNPATSAPGRSPPGCSATDRAARRSRLPPRMPHAHSPRSTRVTRSPAAPAPRAVNRPMTPAPTTTTSLLTTGLLPICQEQKYHSKGSDADELPASTNSVESVPVKSPSYPQRYSSHEIERLQLGRTIDSPIDPCDRPDNCAAHPPRQSEAGH